MVLITSTQINSQTPAKLHFFRTPSLAISLFEHERQPICFICFNIHGLIVIVVAVDDCDNGGGSDDDDHVIVHCSHFHSAFDEKK